MESNHSSLREVLNSIASIQHELVNDQTQTLDSDILMELKGLAARLYLESDIELLTISFPESEAVVAPEVVVSAPEEVVSAPEVVPAFIPEVEHVFEPAVVEVDPVVEVVPVVEVAPVVEVVPVVEVALVVEVIPVVEVAPVIEVAPVAPVAPVVVETPRVESAPVSGFTVDSVIGQMPLSRRFEFSNILFGGNMEKMGLFIQQIIDAPNAAGRLDVYDHWYEECQWRRRDESAGDMLRMIKRIFAS